MGATGPQGPAGATGPAGPQGPQGLPGATGPQGPAGAQGAQGAQGSQGSQGSQGATGAQGAAGANGTNGANGANGAQGAQGAQGATGAAGSQGPQGPAGAQGPAGPQGPAGTASATEVYRNGDQNLPQNVNQTVATMASIPAGSYMFTAKTTLVSDTGYAEAAVTCTLDAGGTIDTSELRIVQLTTPARAILQMQLVKSFAAPGSAVVRCQSDASFNIVARHTTIVAVKVDTATRTAVTG